MSCATMAWFLLFRVMYNHGLVSAVSHLVVCTTMVWFLLCHVVYNHGLVSVSQLVHQNLGSYCIMFCVYIFVLCVLYKVIYR